MSRVCSHPPRLAFARRYLMTVPVGRPTFNGCLVALVVALAPAFATPASAPERQLGTAKPRWSGPHHSTPSRRWEIHGQGAALEAIADDTM